MENYYGNCDAVRSELRVLYYNSDDAICFGFFPTSIHGDYKFRKKPYATHYHLFNLTQIIGEDLCNKLNNNRVGEIRSILCYNKTYGLGRCWEDHKVLAFWKPPTLKTLKKVVRSLRIDPNEFVMIVGTTHRGEQNITVAQYMANIPSEVENEIEIINKPLSSLGLGDIEDMVLNKGKTNITWAAQKEREGWKTMAQRNNALYQESKTIMKRVLRMTESDLHNIIKESVNRILKEGFNQFSDGDFASTGNPYEVDTYNPISEVEHITPQDLRKVYVWETGDSYYEFEADYGEGMSTAVSFRGTFDGDFSVDHVILGHSGFGRQMNPKDIQTPQFEEWFNNTLGEKLANILYSKINSGDFANDAESGY